MCRFSNFGGLKSFLLVFDCFCVCMCTFCWFFFIFLIVLLLKWLQSGAVRFACLFALFLVLSVQFSIFNVKKIVEVTKARKTCNREKDRKSERERERGSKWKNETKTHWNCCHIFHAELAIVFSFVASINSCFSRVAHLCDMRFFSINTAGWLLVFDCNSACFLFSLHALNERQFSCLPHPV